MTRLAAVVAASRRVAETSSRLEKIRVIAACLREVAPDEIPIAIAYLSGETCQGKLGVSYASLQDARAAPAAQPSLQLREVDAAFDELVRVKGKGAAEKRAGLLRALFERATGEEQDFL